MLAYADAVPISPLGPWFWRALLAILGLTTATLLVLLLVDQGIQQQTAQAEATQYTSPPLDYSTTTVVAVLGDSYVGGSEMNTSEKTLWWTQLALRDKFIVQNLGVGGTGYVNGSEKPVPVDFTQRGDKVAPAATVVIVFGSRNDTPAMSNPAQVKTAAAKTYSLIHKAAPNAVLVVVGPPWTDSNAPSWIKADRDAVHAAAAADGATWVDPIAQNWFPTGSGLIGSDGVHPTDKGHAVIADKMQAVVQKAIARSRAQSTATPTPSG